MDAKLNIPLERLEAETLVNFILKKMNQEEKYHSTYNEYTDKWITYVKSFIEKIGG